jgi:hypothetical protein
MVVELGRYQTTSPLWLLLPCVKWFASNFLNNYNTDAAECQEMLPGCFNEHVRGDPGETTKGGFDFATTACLVYFQADPRWKMENKANTTNKVG